MIHSCRGNCRCRLSAGCNDTVGSASTNNMIDCVIHYIVMIPDAWKEDEIDTWMNGKNRSWHCSYDVIIDSASSQHKIYSYPQMAM